MNEGQADAFRAWLRGLTNASRDAGVNLYTSNEYVRVLVAGDIFDVRLTIDTTGAHAKLRDGTLFLVMPDAVRR